MDYNGNVTFEEAQRNQIAGRYGDLLRDSLAEQARARADGRRADEVRWTHFAVLACRLIGRTSEGLTHANQAVELARDQGAEARARAHHGLGLMLMGARRFEEAFEEMRTALESGGPDSLRAAILLETAEMALEAGLREEAQAALTRGSALIQFLGEPRLLAWSLYLRSQLEEPSPADLQLAAAYEIARNLACPELQWQILWRLSERAGAAGNAKMQEDLTWSALMILSKLAEPLPPADATAFWRQGPRRVFLEQAQRRYGPQFLQMVMLGGTSSPDATRAHLQGIGWDPSLIPEFIRKNLPSGVEPA